MRIYVSVMMLILVVYVSADCGCLKCSKHLQGVDIRGPNGCPIKVVFRRPQLRYDCSTASYTPTVQVPIVQPPSIPLPGKSYNYKVQYHHKPIYQQIDDCGGQQYSATLQAPLPTLPKVPLPLLNNLRYRTDTVLVPPPNCDALHSNPLPAPALSAELINWLKNLDISQLRVPASASATNVATGPIFETIQCCDCNRFENIPSLSISNSDIDKHGSTVDEHTRSCCHCTCNRSKRSLEVKNNDNSRCESSKFDGESFLHKIDEECTIRHKRDLAKHGYNFLMSMLPSFVKEEEPNNPKSNIKEKLLKIKANQAGNSRQGAYSQPQFHGGYLLSKEFPRKQTNFHDSNHDLPQKPKYAWQKQNRVFGNSLESPTLPENKSYIGKFLGLAPVLTQPENPNLNSKFKLFAQKQNSPPSNWGNPAFPVKAKESPTASEASLLRKLKKLNHNPFSSNLEDQATVFVKDLLKPQETGRKRGIRSTETLEKQHSRRKRTIIVGSDEIDLPPHYEVEIVSEEDEEPQFEYAELSDEEVEGEEESPMVGDSSFLRKLAQNRVFPGFPPKPDVIMGKNVIQKAVREELNAYHKKLEKEQKIKELKANLQKKHQQTSLVPHNPIFMLLTAPMKFLRHFHDLNKGISPVMASLPKLVYTTKKYFRDFGSNFQKNCLNLASDIIGDFDHIQPNVIQQITQPKGGRYRRDLLEDELRKCLQQNGEIKPVFHLSKDSLDPNINLKNQELSTQKSSNNSFTPDDTMELENPKENFREVPNDHVRKKRYVVKVVDDHEIQHQLEDLLTRKMEDQNSYLKPLQDYYNKVNDFITKLHANHQPLCQNGGECFFYRPATMEEPNLEFDDSYEAKPKKKKVRIKKVKPRVIIDNKGMPFMEYDGFKRPLLLNGRKLLKKSSPDREKSSEETGNKIATLIARAKEDSEMVGNVHKDIIPQQIIKERISSLLEEIDELVHLNAEDYDEIFENLIQVQHIKTSIEQDWKRLLIDNKADDIASKIGLLSKFKDLQQAKDDSVKSIVEELQKNDNEFVRKQLLHSLIRLQKLQCIITSVVYDFEQHLKMKTSFNTKKEIKYVDFLSELKFVNAKTRNDLVRKLCHDRDAEGQRNIELLHKLKKLLITSQGDSEKCDHAAKLIWEMKNLKKLQTQTVDEMNQKASRNFKIKKELRILFDLQKRYEDCEMELNELLGNLVVGATGKGAQKKDIKEIIAEIKQRQEEVLQKAKERAGSLHRLKNS